MTATHLTRPSAFRRLLQSGAVPPLLVAVLLVGIAVEKALFHVSGSDAQAYHDAVRETVDAVPLDLGDWDGRDIDVTPSAIALLRPNVLQNRRYTNAETGERASVLLVHCRDARDLLGHFPPVCYPAHGYAQESTEDQDWTIDGFVLHGRRYRFTQEDLGLTTDFVLDNVMILPQGSTTRDMDGVNDVARDIRLRHFGAAQVQVLTDPRVTDERRDEILDELLSAYVASFRRIADGGSRER